MAGARTPVQPSVAVMAAQTRGDEMTSNVLGREATRHDDPSIEDPQGRGKRFSRLFGTLFLAGFPLYGIGFGLVNSVTMAHDFLAGVAASSTILVAGAFLMLLNTAVDIGKGVLFFPIAERRGKRTALVYLAAITVQVVLLDLGVLFLLLLVPLSELATSPSSDGAAAMASLLTQANTIAFNIGQATLSFGGVFMTWFLFRTHLVPRVLAAWGVVGYAIHLTGAIADIFGLQVGLALSLPGGLFELALGLWLMAKGFSSVIVPRLTSAPASQAPAPSMAPAR